MSKKKPSYYSLSEAEIIRKFGNKSVESVFTEIYRENFWEQRESISGPGSSLKQTAKLIEQLPELFRKFEIKSILDIPCGDFHWMQEPDLSGIKYIGADIVEALIKKNQNDFPKLDFRVLNLLEDQLPNVDLLFCRDCLVHFSFDDIFIALKNIAKSKIKYIMTTTFPDKKSNKDIQTGDWRPINLEIAPFHLPPPLFILNEQCTEMDGQYADKSLGLWGFEQLL